MKSCFASRVQAAANSFVDVTGSMGPVLSESRGAVAHCAAPPWGIRGGFSDITIRSKFVPYPIVIMYVFSFISLSETQRQRCHESRLRRRVRRTGGDQIWRSSGSIARSG